MILRKKILSFGIPAALVLCAGVAAVAYTGGGGNCKSKATKASASVQATGDEAAGCCASKAKATTASNTTASNSCASAKATNASTTASNSCASVHATSAGASCAMKAGSASCGVGSTTADAQCTFPEGTKMTRVEVPGGMDVIFTGTSLPEVESTLRAMAGSCNDNPTCATKCSVSSTAGSVVLAIRGENAEACCRAVGVTTAVTASTGEKGCVEGATMAGDKGCCASKGAAGAKAAEAAKPAKTVVKES